MSNDRFIELLADFFAGDSQEVKDLRREYGEKLLAKEAELEDVAWERDGLEKELHALQAERDALVAENKAMIRRSSHDYRVLRQVHDVYQSLQHALYPNLRSS